jgi:hypothetical protein
MGASVSFMVGAWVVFCVVVRPVLESCVPVVSKLVLRYPTTEPPEVHIHHLAPARDNSIVKNPASCGVVCLDRAFGLWPSHVNEGLVVGNHLACSDKESCKLGFSSRCHNKVDDLGKGEYSPIECGYGSFSERKICAPAWLQDWESLRKPASTCAHRIMSLAR